MTDRELMESAAKAAGHNESRWFSVDCFQVRRPDRLWDDWNPLTDDGDALRLAVELGLHISQQLSYVTVCHPHGPAATRGLGWAVPYDAADPYAATRRAIVRAAAAVGAA